MSHDSPLLKIEQLAIEFEQRNTIVRAVNDVSLSIYPGQTLAVVGESGSGKSVTAMSILQLIPCPPGRVSKGTIEFDGRPLLSLSQKEMRRIRGNQIAMIFQEPMTSLNPVYTIGWQILEAIHLHQQVSDEKALEIAEQALRDVGIAEPRRRLDEYPHQLSGGMRQRVMIAMALACNPRLLIADEPTTALDVTIQAQILELLRRLQTQRGMSIMLITHDLGVVAENADAVAVMYAGRIVEYGSVIDVFSNPLHPYTRGLFASMPRLGHSHRRLSVIPGQVPNPTHLPKGCAFHPRCDQTCQIAGESADELTVNVSAHHDAHSQTRRIMKRCTHEDPALREIHPRHWAACSFIDGHDHARDTQPVVTFRRTDQPVS